VRLWDAGTARELRSLKGHTGPISSVAYAPDGKTLASGSADRTVRVWDVGTAKELHRFEGHHGPVAYSRDGKRLAFVTEGNACRLVETVTGKDRLHRSGHLGAITALSFSPDGTRLVSASVDTTLLIWDLVSGAATPGPLSAEDLHSSWNALAGPDAALAFQ